jgi:hypothetical protein
VGQPSLAESQVGDTREVEDLPELFEKYGQHDRATALRRLIEERDSLREEVVQLREAEHRRSRTGPWKPLSVDEVSKVRSLLIRYGVHLPACTGSPCTCGFTNELAKWEGAPCHD